MLIRSCYLLVLLILACLLAACAGLPTLGRGGQPPDPLAAHRAAMAPSQRSLLDDLPPLPEVRMEVHVDPAEPLLTGKMVRR